MAKRYGDRNHMELDRNGNHYSNHVSAMTGEGLHEKSDIAAELAYRDSKIAELRELCDELACMIRENQFAAEIHGEEVCVECYEYPQDGHAKDCKLARLLAKYEQFIKEQGE